MLRFALICGLLAGVSLDTGCARRDAPYRFRAPLVSSVRAEHVPPAHVAADASVSAVSSAGVGDTDRHGIHHRPARIDQDTLAGRLRSFVGKRESMAGHAEFAVSALAALGVTVDKELSAVSDGPALMALATARGAVADRATKPLVGDLLVFDDVVKGQPHSLVGVVVATRDDGTVEFLYLWRRVIRRGFVNPRRPKRPRDATGRVLNTFVRHFDTRGKRGLAGELVSAHVRLEHLAQAGFVR